MKEYTYEQLETGMTATFSITVTEEMLEQFMEISKDENPLHLDASYARQKGYKDKVAYGMLTASFMSTIAGMYLPGKRSLIHKIEAEFPRPVYVGDTLRVEGKVSEKEDAFRLIYLKVVIRNEQGEKVLRGKMRVQVLD